MNDPVPITNRLVETMPAQRLADNLLVGGQKKDLIKFDHRKKLTPIET